MKKQMFLMLIAILLAAPQMAPALSIEEAVGLALDNNHAVKRTGYEHDSAREGIAVARAGFWPTLKTSYSYAQSSEDAYGSNRERSTATITAAYNIFSGFSDQNSAREAEARASAAKYQARSMRAEVALAARRAYTEVLRTRGTLNTATEGVELLERQLNDAELFFKEGLTARNQLLKVVVELATAKQNLLEAKGNHNNSHRRLENTIGIEVSVDDLQPLPATPEGPEGMDMEAMEDVLLANRSELKFLRLSEKAYGYASSAAGGAMLPKVDLSMAYSEYGDSLTIGGRETPYDNEVVTMFTASWTLYEGFRPAHSRKRLKYKARAARQQLLETEKELLLQFRSATEDFGIARQMLVVAESGVAQAQENYRVTDLQFKERIATTTDLLDARTYLTDAKNRHNTALYDLHMAGATIDRILERNIPAESATPPPSQKGFYDSLRERTLDRFKK